MNETGDPDDATLLARLDISGERADAWGRLLAVADEFAVLPHAEGDYGWTPGRPRTDGLVGLGYPAYADRVERARFSLSEVGAVTPAYHWMKRRPPTVPDDGSPLSPADAVRLATTTVRGERFCDGAIGQAVEDGTLQAILASLAAWYRALTANA